MGLIFVLMESRRQAKLVALPVAVYDILQSAAHSHRTSVRDGCRGLRYSNGCEYE